MGCQVAGGAHDIRNGLLEVCNCDSVEASENLRHNYYQIPVTLKVT